MKNGVFLFGISFILEIFTFLYHANEETVNDIITFLICIIQKHNLSKTKNIPKRKTPFLIFLKKINSTSNFFFTSKARL